jgi:RimJ/RimL family protein N-acetyltransferase
MTDLICTERLILRPLTAADAEPTARLMSPAIARWTGSWNGETTAAEVAERIARQDALAQQGLSLDRAMALREGGALIGWIGVRKRAAEDRRGSLGYWIGEAFFGLGYTREAARAFLPRAFAPLDLDIVEAVAQLAACRSEGLDFPDAVETALVGVAGRLLAPEALLLTSSRGARHICLHDKGWRPASTGGAEGEHPLHVPGHGHEAPLASDLVQAAH